MKDRTTWAWRKAAELHKSCRKARILWASIHNANLVTTSQFESVIPEKYMSRMIKFVWPFLFIIVLTNRRKSTVRELFEKN